MPEPTTRAKLDALRLVDPIRFRQVLRDALVETGGNVVKTAAKLGVPLRAAWRWIEPDHTILDGTGHVGRGPRKKKHKAR